MGAAASDQSWNWKFFQSAAGLVVAFAVTVACVKGQQKPLFATFASALLAGKITDKFAKLKDNVKHIVKCLAQKFSNTCLG